MNKKIYNYNSDGYFINSSNARIDPLESKKQKKEIYLLPKNSTFTKPPATQEGKVLKWDQGIWILENEKKADEEEKLTDAQILKNAKDKKLGEIYIARQEYQYSNITYNDQEYSNTLTAQNKFFNLANSTNSDIEWRLAHGSWIVLNKEQITELKNLIIQKETASYKEESRLTKLVNDAKNTEELKKNIIWKLQ